MAIDIDDASFRQLLATTGTDQGLSKSEIRGIIAIAQLSAWIDFDEAREERSLLDTLTEQLCAVAGLDPETIHPLSPVPIDDEERVIRIARLATRLDRAPPRELAYALAYLLIVADLELAPVESELLGEVQRILAISTDRADDLVAGVAAVVTPPERFVEQPYA